MSKRRRLPLLVVLPAGVVVQGGGFYVARPGT